MEKYHNFIGIDIGKFNFVVSIFGSKSTTEYENSASGIEEFISKHRDILPNSLSVVEATGGHELALLNQFIEAGYPVSRADARKVKNFIRSYGAMAKTDKLDAKALACYAKERHTSLTLFQPRSGQQVELSQLVQRRIDLKQMMIAEKNRLSSPSNKYVKESICKTIELLQEQIKELTAKAMRLIQDDRSLKAKFAALLTIPGIGNIVALELVVLLPELGMVDRRKIASLAGVAPKANDSGRFSGYRRTGHGRIGIKPILFIAAMAAANSKTELKLFYEKLITKGKKKMVALTALMRKILVIANAKLKISHT
jgi:transposase